MKLIQGENYRVDYEKWIPTRTHQSGFVVERELRKFHNTYEYIGWHFNKYHFYNSNEGLDIYLDKEELDKFNVKLRDK